jgi:hypothetical protein
MNNNNILYGALGALAVVSAILGYLYYEEHREARGLDISVGKTGITIEKK